MLASGSMSTSTSTPTRDPEAMRHAMAAYVRALHEAYLDASAPLSPGDRGRQPLLTAGRITVLAIGTRYLHVVGTADPLPAPSGPEVEIHDEVPGLEWRLRFFDPVIAPELGLIDEGERPKPQRVREVLGVRRHLYHLAVPPGSGLTAHHALHAGTGLAHAHAAAERDFQEIAALVPRHADLVAEMHGAHVAGLPVAHLLLAQLIAPDSPTLAAVTPAADADDVRRTLLAWLRGARHD